MKYAITAANKIYNLEEEYVEKNNKVYKPSKKNGKLCFVRNGYIRKIVNNLPDMLDVGDIIVYSSYTKHNVMFREFIENMTELENVKNDIISNNIILIEFWKPISRDTYKKIYTKGEKING